MAYKSNSIITDTFSTMRKTALCVLAGYLLACSASAFAQIKYYRYLNNDGVKVISHTIPPEYAQKGYEVITHTGKVLEVVSPAPDPEELKQQEITRAKERELMAEYQVLARRYSSISEIYAARDRRLAHLDASIAILRSNIGNISNQVDNLMKKAAEVERSGRDVPQQILQNIEETRAELRTTEEMLQARLDEHGVLHDEYEKQVELFKSGKALEESKKTTGNR
jgi:hypothetical protein